MMIYPILNAETANQYYTKFFIEDFDNLQPNYVSAFKIG